MNNKSQKLVSVIIPAYNIEKYISQTIESVIRQTYKNIEIIIVNDGSTDNTPKIIQEYSQKDKRVKVINQSNKGLSAARNSGLKIAKGEYLCIIDADDIMMPEKIESQFIFLEDNPLGDFTYSKVRYFINNTSDIYVRDLSTPNGTTSVYKKLLQSGNFISPNSVFFRRSVFDEFGGFDEKLRSSEDFDYWLYLSKRGVNFLHQDKYLTLCRSRKDSLTADSVTMYSSVINVFEKHIFNSRNKFLAKIMYTQYVKNIFLLYFSILRKPKSKNIDVMGVGSNFLSLSYYLNNIYMFLKKLKFLLTFKKINDKVLKDYLIFIESLKIYEPIS